MGKRTLESQILHAIYSHSAMGESKHSASDAERSTKIYSLRRMDSLKKTSKNFANFIKMNFPEVKMVVDIKKDHVEAYLNNKKINWNLKTFEEKNSELKKISAICSATYRGAGWSGVRCDPPDRLDKVRTVTMSHRDLDLLRDQLKKSRAAAKDALEISARCGLRSEECACLRGQDIRLDQGRSEIYVSREGAKNGRDRTVPIRPKDVPFFQSLKERSGEGYCCRGCKAESLNNGIRLTMKSVGIDEKYKLTTIHSIRKMYAQDRMAELRGSSALLDKAEEMKAWDIVSAELGHGPDRQALYDVYIGGR